MAPTATSHTRRSGYAAIALFLLGLLAILGGCDVLAETRLELDVRSQPGESLGFEPSSINAPAQSRVALSFANVSSLDHNLVFLDPIEASTRAIVRPGELDRLEFETPGAGIYEFVCTIHEDMRGTLAVR